MKAAVELAPAMVRQGALAAWRGRTVSVTHLPGTRVGETADACARLRDAGASAVPHLAARDLRSAAELREAVERSGAHAAIVVAGGAPEPVGPFATALDALQALETLPQLRRVYFAGHPEGHPHATAAELRDAVSAKAALARRMGLEPALVAQCTLSEAAVGSWAADASAELPVVAGVAGPASVAAMRRFARKCGVGESRELLWAMQEDDEWDPAPMVRALSPGTFAGAHIFAFGGPARTLEFVERMEGEGVFI